VSARRAIGRGAAAAALLAVLAASNATATGITADAGMTPPLDRWIVRTQLRHIERRGRAGMARRMRTAMAPVMAAYGIAPRATLIARQGFMHRRMNMASRNTADLGFGDLLLKGKFSVLRINKSGFIFAVSPTFGIESPTGDKDFGSGTWDAVSGVYLSARLGRWGADANVEHQINGVGERRAARPGDEFSLTVAAAYQFSLDKDAQLSLWPVLETAYTSQARERSAAAPLPNSGGETTLLSPGLKFAWNSFMLEFLLQVPVAQRNNGVQLRRKTGGLFGARYMF
jgi:hypothetical protein